MRPRAVSKLIWHELFAGADAGHRRARAPYFGGEILSENGLGNSDDDSLHLGALSSRPPGEEESSAAVRAATRRW